MGSPPSSSATAVHCCRTAFKTRDAYTKTALSEIPNSAAMADPGRLRSIRCSKHAQALAEVTARTRGKALSMI
jgi:hypothetical protein